MKKKDLMLIGAILLAAAAIFAGFSLTREEGAYVVVRIDGKMIAEYSLLEDAVYSLNGGSNILTVENGGAYISEASCPDKLCVKQGRADRSGEVITCLPNKLTVTVYGQDGDVELTVD